MTSIALVTGASRGLGRNTALHIAHRRVVVRLGHRHVTRSAMPCGDRSGASAQYGARLLACVT